MAVDRQPERLAGDREQLEIAEMGGEEDVRPSSRRRCARRYRSPSTSMRPAFGCAGSKSKSWSRKTYSAASRAMLPHMSSAIALDLGLAFFRIGLPQIVERDAVAAEQRAQAGARVRSAKSSARVHRQQPQHDACAPARTGRSASSWPSAGAALRERRSGRHRRSGTCASHGIDRSGHAEDDLAEHVAAFHALQRRVDIVEADFGIDHRLDIARRPSSAWRSPCSPCGSRTSRSASAAAGKAASGSSASKRRRSSRR